MFRSTGVKQIVKTLLVLLLWVSCFLNLGRFRQQVKTQSISGSPTASEARFQQVRRVLSGVDRVGYISEEVPFAKNTSGSSALHYFLAQYALAPVIVELGTSPKLIIGDFEGNPRSVPENLVLLQDFGAGIRLFHRS